MKRVSFSGKYDNNTAIINADTVVNIRMRKNPKLINGCLLMILNKNSIMKNVIKLVTKRITMRQLRFNSLFNLSPSLPKHCIPIRYKIL